LLCEPARIDERWLLPGHKSRIREGLGARFWYGVRTGGKVMVLALVLICSRWES